MRRARIQTATSTRSELLYAYQQQAWALRLLAGLSREGEWTTSPGAPLTATLTKIRRIAQRATRALPGEEPWRRPSRELFVHIRTSLEYLLVAAGLTGVPVLPRDPTESNPVRLARIALELRLALGGERGVLALRTTNRTLRATFSAGTRNIGETGQQTLHAYLTHLRHLWGTGEGFFFPPIDHEIFPLPLAVPRTT